MGTKNDPGIYDCYATLHPNETYFLIKARDPSGGQIVRAWAHARARLINQGLKPESDRTMVAEALKCADAMDKWRSTYNSDGSLRESLVTTPTQQVPAWQEMEEFSEDKPARKPIDPAAQDPDSGSGC